MDWMPFIWLAVTLLILRLIEHWVHRHLQGVALLLTGDRDMAVVLYALPLLPGVLLHEMSHLLAAVLLRVRVGGMSVHPKIAGDRIQLGFVPIEKTDVVRASLIGLAPLLSGSAVILLIGYLVFGVDALRSGLVTRDWALLGATLAGMLRATDAGIWAYLIFSIGNTMVPSRSDRQAWLPTIGILVLIGALIWTMGLGSAVLAELATTLIVGATWLATMCTVTIIIDLPFVLLIALLEQLLQQVRGLRIEY
ncbi:MAG: hypothetical protein GX620_01170 [Chloroflexi bacterium]|nr:hypothetical protein [Chloroflexota bacterium]